MPYHTNCIRTAPSCLVSSWSFCRIPGKTGILRMTSKYPSRSAQSALAAFVRYFSTERREKYLLGVIAPVMTSSWIMCRRRVSQASLDTWNMPTSFGTPSGQPSKIRENLHVAGKCLQISPHDLIYRSFNFFHITEKINAASMRFTTQRYTTNWQALEVGIMMGCIISPQCCFGKKGTVPRPIKTFMDDVTILIDSRSGTERLNELFTRCRMKEKLKKRRSLSIVHGQVKEIHFSIVLKEQPIKSLGRWYSIPLIDRHRDTEIEETATKGLTTIDEIDFPAGKRKAWIFQHLPPSSPPVAVTYPQGNTHSCRSNPTPRQQIHYKIARRLSQFYICWAVQRSTNDRLPISSVVDEFKACKVRFNKLLWDSSDQVMRVV